MLYFRHKFKIIPMKKYLVYTIIISFFFIKCVDLKPNLKSKYIHTGIDISHHNNIENWSKFKNDISFCFIKATQGSNFKDPEFDMYWNQTKKNGIIRGAYCFFQPGVPAEKQFNNFKKHVKLQKGDLPPVLDVELKECDIDEVNKWLKLAENHYKVKPIVYSDYLFFKVFMDGKIDEKYPLWLYINHKFKVVPSFNDYKCIFWQYNQWGRINGIEGDIDMNYFIGDDKSFNDMLIK
jgi:lysozyme